MNEERIMPSGIRRKKGHWIVEDAAMNEILIVLRLGAERMNQKEYFAWAKAVLAQCSTIHSVMEEDGFYK